MLLFALLTGCANDASTLFAGPGTNLLISDTQERVALQDKYFDLMCRHAGLYGGSCRAEVPEQWRRVTYVALNDIDDRCEAYVNSLHRAKREGDAYIGALTRTSTTANTILGQTFDKASASGARAIAVVQAAFNLGENSLRNYYSRLLLAIPPTDVQQLLLKRQTAFRIALRDGVSDNSGIARYMPLNSRSDANYVISSYLRICLPASIEAAISEGIEDLVFLASPTAQIPATARTEAYGRTPPRNARRVDPDVGALAVRK